MSNESTSDETTLEDMRDQRDELIAFAYEAVESYFSIDSSDRSVETAMMNLRDLLREHDVWLYGEPRIPKRKRR